MPKALPIAALLTVIALSPAYAASDECTDAHMAQMEQMIGEMTDAAAKKSATTASRHVEGRDEEGQRGRVHGAYGRSPQSYGHVASGQRHLNAGRSLAVAARTADLCLRPTTLPSHHEEDRWTLG